MATSTKTAPKSASKATAKAAPKAAAASASASAASGDDEDAPAGEGKVKAPSLKIKELVTRVTAATGGKKKGVKEIVEATLRELGEALSRGEEPNLPGFGRTRIARSAEKDGASMMTLKVKRGAHRKHSEAGKDPLAEDGEDS